MKLAIITALHGRYELTKLFLEYYQDLAVEGVELGLFCACTTGEYEMRDIVESYPGWNVSFSSNLPLTRKFGANLPKAREWGADAVMILGSDDFVSADYAQTMVHWVAKSIQFVGNRIVHYIDLGTDQVIQQWDMGGRAIGAGRVLFKELLDELNWYPWLDDETTGLDKSMLMRLNEVSCNKVIKSHPGLLDCKLTDSKGNGLNQTAYDTVRSWPHEQVDAYKYLDEHFPAIKERLLEW